MKKIIIPFLLFASVFSVAVSAQVPTNISVQIVRAEDERRYDVTLENLFKNPNASIRKRAMLAAGRIGDERAVSALAKILEGKETDENKAMAMFAIGEIESVKGADAVLSILDNTKISAQVRARAIEAAGKIAAANPKDAKAKDLGEAILENMEFENGRRSMSSRDVILLGLTAILRARPEQGDITTAKFLTNMDARIRVDAANTLSRLRSKNVNAELRAILMSDDEPLARANAARALGAAEDKDAVKLLLEAATNDDDSRVRVSAIRSLGNLKDASVAEKLFAYGNKLAEEVRKSKNANHPHRNELLEIAVVSGRLLPNTENENALEFLLNLRQAEITGAPESSIAMMQIAPKLAIDALTTGFDDDFSDDWRESSAVFQGVAELAKLESNAPNDEIKAEAQILLIRLIGNWMTKPVKVKAASKGRLAVPDLLSAYAAFKPAKADEFFALMLEGEPDEQIRAALAGILSEFPNSKIAFEALKKAFDDSFLRDKTSNDAMLAILDALFKVNQTESLSTIFLALNSDDFLVRKKAFELFRKDDSAYSKAMIERALSQKKNQILPSTNPRNGSKQGVLLNKNADYIRAVSRKNGTVKAVLTTEKGAFTIDLMPEDAPLTVDNFIKLARANYFNGVTVHRVVPNFVMQDGDPRGDGNGGPGWSIRCEINMLDYRRGAVGMALSGKDTGGSQWFATHSPQPHLDGGYTVFGYVNETDMKIVDSIVRGDKILSVKIAEGKSLKIAR